MAEFEHQIIAAGNGQAETLPRVAGGSGELSKSARRRLETTDQSLAETLHQIRTFDPSSLLSGESRTYKPQAIRKGRF